MSQGHGNTINKISGAGLLVTLGIIFGDIGTSPLYVMRAIMGSVSADPDLLVYGGLSCVFWTLTLQTTIKYVIITLRADNNGEGGIFSLYALVRRRYKFLYWPAIIGGSALLADGIITPPISVVSAVEGLKIINPNLPVVEIALVIISGLFLIQRFGTGLVGKAFGPVMLVWFSTLGTLGFISLIQHPWILKAISPHYAFQLLFLHPGGIWVLGAVFLCTTGAEALYSDLGHCGLKNIRLSWVFVKLCLLLNYFGQGAWIIEHPGGFRQINPFYALMPQWLLIPGIILASCAAVVASQALISGSYTLISEAIRLNFWPKLKIRYPGLNKGQLYIPAVNTLLWAGCMFVVLFFKNSENMEAAYGLAITFAMLVTTTLMSFYLLRSQVSRGLIVLFLAVFLSIEGFFLYANASKFMHGGWFTFLLGGSLAVIMIIWYKAEQYKQSLIEYVPVRDYIDQIKELSKDESIPKYATNLIYLTPSEKSHIIDSKIIYSIFQKQPKRADIYWFVHVEVTDEPHTMEYTADVMAEDDLIWVNIRLGFRIENKINVFFRQVVQDMVACGEVNIASRYSSLSKMNINGDFRFVVQERFLSYDNSLPYFTKLILDAYYFIKNFSYSAHRWYGLDAGSVTVEQVPLVINPIRDMRLKRIK